MMSKATEKDRKEAEENADNPEFRRKYKLWARPSHIDVYLAALLAERARGDARLTKAVEALEMWLEFRGELDGSYVWYRGAKAAEKTREALAAIRADQEGGK